MATGTTTAVQTRTTALRQTRHSDLALRSPAHDRPRSRASRSHPPPDARVAKAAILQERGRIAHELHDTVLQTLYALTLTLSRAQRLVTDDQAGVVENSLDDAMRLANDGQRELRAAVTDIRSDPRAPDGLTVALASLATDLRAHNGLDVHLSVTDEPDVPR